MSCTLCAKKGIPCICSCTSTDACDAFQPAQKNACSLCNHSNHTARGDLAQDGLMRTPSFLTMMKEFPSQNELCNYNLADGNASRQLAPFLQVLICPPPSDAHFTPQPEQRDYLDNEGWKWQEDI
ncbi:hypothetical protein O181_086299 [Austropuccinia psidii MF-1]|uniref:Uncharacterized protein n=1 Tax=Austropuccinia psidii MF-1 TaxID=1389203 RepID=A0A9Q3FWQ6_9BASI|nr:hypothetical protein [Austropuccinia psidii MF-1]